ncbi:efflux RND transporter periplasmic adaptor subunit [Pandoraea terrigena]|nr:efflux RND transporter periplasmic adaptor subunit [Pandoraea terrigena]
MKTWVSTPRRRWLVGGGVALALVAAGLIWHGRPKPPVFLSTSVMLGDIEDTVLATGIIKAAQQVYVGSQASGQIKTLPVKVGQLVKRGDLIAEIDSLTQQNSLKTARASLADVQAQRASKAALLAQYQLAFERQKEMLAQDAGSKADYDSAKASLDSTRADIASLDAQIDEARISVNTAEVNLGYTRIVAPMDGTIVAVPVQAGQTVNASQSAPTIVTMADLGTMTVKAEISEADVLRVKPGMPVSFTVLGDPDNAYHARLASIDPGPESYSSDSSSLSSSSTSATSSSSSSSSSSSTSSTAIYYYGLFDVPNPNGKLRISMTAQVAITVASHKQVMTLPASALGARGDDGRYTVLVLGPDGRPQPHRVSVGINNTVSAEILSGLKVGDKVVIGDGNSAPSTSSGRPMGPPSMGM